MTDTRLEFTGDYGPVQRNFDKLAPAVWAPVPQARVFNSAAISLVNNTEAALTFNSERYDNGALHSTSVSTDRLTAPVTGLYAIGACVRFAANATGDRYAYLRINNTTVIESDIRRAATLATQIPLSTQYQLTAGDYVQVVAFQNSGGALNVEVSGGSPEFWMVRLAGFTAQVFE